MISNAGEPRRVAAVSSAARIKAIRCTKAQAARARIYTLRDLRQRLGPPVPLPPPLPSFMLALPDLSKRILEPEAMDDPALDAALHEQALRGLSRINAVSASAWIIWRPIRELARRSGGAKPRVLDAACGGGDVAVRLWRHARRAGVALHVEGCDISGRAVDFARQHAASRGADVRFIRHDVIGDGLPGGYDVIVTSLFLHHLDDGQALRFLGQASRAAGRLLLVNDLRRSRAGYAMAVAGTRLLSRSGVVHADGPQSVRAAFTVPEARELSRQAGLEGAVVQRRWPWRWLLTWRNR
jgi:SAM-dependent methyltransferase